MPEQNERRPDSEPAKDESLTDLERAAEELPIEDAENVRGGMGNPRMIMCNRCKRASLEKP
jgi:hypothetical protein